MYEIAGLKIHFEADFEINQDKFKSYKSSYKGEPDLKVAVTGTDFIEKTGKKLLLDDSIIWYSDSVDDNKLVVYLPNAINKDEMICRLIVDKEWKNASLSYLKRIKGIESTILNIYGNILMRNRILFHKGVLLHASSVKYHNSGIIFSAPSGTGKSTHAALWEKHLGACVINDDTPALRITGDEIVVHGTPWSGSEEKNMNISAPLKAIIILEQNKENHIARLTKKEITPRLLPRFLLPYHDNTLMGTAIDYANKIIETIPVYLLKCRPDREAAELVRESIM